ncbi:MAG: glycosyltransferase [Gemmatimonadaceae bacterium]
MRVLHVIPATAPRYGGPSVALRGMTEALAALGAEVTVAATDADGPRARLDVALDRAVVERGVEYRYFARTGGGEWKYSWPLTRWLWASAGRFDVVHVHALFSYATIPGCRAAERAGVPFVLRPLGTLGSWSVAHRRWKKLPYLALVERHHLARAAAIHATSEAEREEVAALGYGAKARVVPLGVTAPDGSGARRGVRPDGGRLRLLFLSRLHPKKGLPLVFEALALLPAERRARVELVVAGDGEEAYAAELRAIVARLGVAGAVSFVGHVGGETKRALYESANAFVLPSSHENFGIAAAEALAAGLPVVLSDAVAIAGDVAAAGAGLVVPREAGAIAAAVAALLDDPARRRAMGERAAALAAQRYSWRRTASELLELYHEVASGARRAAAERSGAGR